MEASLRQHAVVRASWRRGERRHRTEKKQSARLYEFLLRPGYLSSLLLSLSLLDLPDRTADANFTSSFFPLCLSMKIRERKIGVGLIFLSDKGLPACQTLSYGTRSTAREEGFGLRAAGCV
jgi:hypothetical protein